MPDRQPNQQRVASVETGFEEDLAHANRTRKTIGRQHGNDAGNAHPDVQQRDREKQKAHHAALELTRTVAADVEYWPTPDPTVSQGSREQRLDAYRDVRDGLGFRIRQRLR